jgi:tetratricopeptide (TPR) repeat protein
VPVSKSRRKDGKTSARPAPRKSPPADPLLDPFAEGVSPRMAMERIMAGIQGSLFGDDPVGDLSSDPLSAAQDVLYDAWDSGTRKDRVALAKRALGISDLCADAWLLLAEEEAKGIVERRAVLEKALAAGDAALRHVLGDNALEDEEGNFWGILETRPYMRARAALADCLWEMGERDEAVAHWQDMLRLCPGDNMGIRHVLASRLLRMNRFQAVDELLSDYEEEDFAEWCYTRALLKFRQGGANSGATQALTYAIEKNPHVPAYLLGEKRLPRQIPPHYALGSKEEAISYVLNSGDVWAEAKGALIWLAETAKNTL